MITGILSFLGGSAFRFLIGHIADFFEKKQEHEHEVERMRLEKELEEARHARDCERIRLQAELEVKEVMVKSDANVSGIEAQAFVEAMKAANTPTGIAWVDAWNGVIRPLAATIAIVLWVFALNEAGFKMSEWDKELVGVIFGFFFASRELTKRKAGKV